MGPQQNCSSSGRTGFDWSTIQLDRIESSSPEETPGRAMATFPWGRSALLAHSSLWPWGVLVALPRRF